MNKSEFIRGLKDILECEDIDLNEETNLKELACYDSLAVMSVIAFLDEHCGKNLSAAQLSAVTTVRDLMNLADICR